MCTSAKFKFINTNYLCYYMYDFYSIMTYVLMCIVNLILYYQVFESNSCKSFFIISFFLVAMSICLWAILKVILIGHVSYIKISLFFSSFWPFLFVISFQCKVSHTRHLTRFCIFYFLFVFNTS